MQFKTPESALQAKSQEQFTSKPYSPHNGAAFETKVGEKITAARQSIQDMSRDLVGRARQSATATDDYVRAQPWKAIGIGAAIGVVLGMFFALRARTTTPASADAQG